MGLDFFKKESLMMEVAFEKFVPQQRGEYLQSALACYHCIIHTYSFRESPSREAFRLYPPNRYGNHQP